MNINKVGDWSLQRVYEEGQEEELECYQRTLIWWEFRYLEGGGVKNLVFASSVLNRWNNDEIVKMCMLDMTWSPCL